MAPFRLKIIRAAFATGERLAPSLAGRAGFALFCRTPKPNALTSREKQAVESRAGFMATARHHRIRVPSGCVTVHEFRPDGARRAAGSVLVLHGWRSRTEYMSTLIDGYRKAGFRIFSLDLPGHGQSTGRALTVASAVQSVGLAAQWFGPFDAVVGHSFGGAVAVNAIAGTIKGVAPLDVERMVLIAAPDALSDVLDGFGRTIALGPRSRAAMVARIEAITGRPLGDFSGSGLLSRMTIPALIVHAPDDREVSVAEARAYAKAGNHVSVHWADGLGHRRILSDPHVVDKIVGFLAERASPKRQLHPASGRAASA